MSGKIVMGWAVACLVAPAIASAQVTPPTVVGRGTRVDVVASGEVNRVPDLAIISAGVVSKSATAVGAIQANAARMERVRAALRHAGIADRDIQTSTINLNPDYVYADRQPPRLIGYQATNMVSVRFRDIGSTGKILDSLVAEGANQINGPTLTFDKPEDGLGEARIAAVRNGREKAELYARALGMRVVRVLSVSESGGYSVPPPMLMAERSMDAAQTKIEPGEQRIQVSVTMSFELQ